MKEEHPTKNKQEPAQLEKGHLQIKQIRLYKLRTHLSVSATQLQVLFWSCTENAMSICEE